MVVQNPAISAPAPVAAPTVASQGMLIQGAAPAAQGNLAFGAQLPAQPPVHVDPALGVGLTPNEQLAENIRLAQSGKAYEPQDFRPADPDPFRLYWFREPDGHWAVFQRRQIERLNARWYRTDEGVFYAVRLPDPPANW